MTVERKIIVNAAEPEETRIAVVEEGKLCEFFIERIWDRHMAGDIYKARVDTVLPGMHAAFVNLGEGRNAFLYLADAKGHKVEPNAAMLVQVMRVARKGKGARVTAHISLPGRYVVLVPGGREIGVSRRIESPEERRRLRTLARQLRPKGFGLIVRTAAVGADEDLLIQDLTELMDLWRSIEQSARSQEPPCLIYKDMGLLGRILRDEVSGDISEIVVDSEEEYKEVREYIDRFCPEKPPEVSLHRGNVPIFEFYDLEKEIEEALDRKAWLPSGGYLVIDQTEAFTIIDVNTGKYVGKANLRQTVLDTNLEAASEIARQIRLRALGGIIIVDFIDMDREKDQQALLSRLGELFKGDHYRARVFGITHLGLVEMTRKRARPDARAVLSRNCPFCSGNGWVLKEDAVAMNLKRFLRKVALSSKPEAVLVEMYPNVACYVAETYLSGWEEELGLRVFIRETPEFQWAKYRLDFQGPLEQAERRVRLLQEAKVVVHSNAASEGV